MFSLVLATWMATVPLADDLVPRVDLAAFGRLLQKKVRNLQGQPGLWKARDGKFQLFIEVDERLNRVRIMIPVRPIDCDDKQLLLTLLSANFDRALEAKYAVNRRMIWSVFSHPFDTLTEADLDNALKQVRQLAENTGTTFSSTNNHFATMEVVDDDD
ncbi:MAG: hypothetical protein KatS3mg105_2427 [Gemmatales bacterium]|nr:MAG: hypothetical protein KatS3mg105_2427 [Gemmatales bacterium]